MRLLELFEDEIAPFFPPPPLCWNEKTDSAIEENSRLVCDYYNMYIPVAHRNGRGKKCHDLLYALIDLFLDGRLSYSTKVFVGGRYHQAGSLIACWAHSRTSRQVETF
jgi:hypothetical protein